MRASRSRRALPAPWAPRLERPSPSSALLENDPLIAETVRVRDRAAHWSECFGVKLRMLAGDSVVALVAHQSDQLSSQWMASRPLRKCSPLPAASSFDDSFSGSKAW